MVQALALNHILGIPLLTKSFGLFRLANRAVSLLSVFPVKKMTKFTMSFLGIDCSYASRVLQGVFSDSKDSQVRWVNAVTPSARMINNHTGRNISQVEIVRDAMRSTRLSLKEKGPISIFVERALPKMAVVPFLPFGIKTIQFSFGIPFHKPLLPVTPLV